MNSVSALLVDLDKCIGCYACLVGCHTWNKVTENQRVEMVILDPQEVDGSLKATYFPLMTHDCDLCSSKQGPLCVDFCPTEALIPCDKKSLVTMLSSDRRCIVTKVDKQMTQLGRKI
jgi:Fe-S-cluster-containing dehydrogenase component